MAATILTAEILKNLVSYDFETGVLRWLPRNDLGKITPAWNKRFSGASVGCIQPGSSYLRSRFFGKFHLVHRLVWLYCHGDWPSGSIDHKDGDRLNNRVENLRIVTSTSNAQNRQPHLKKIGLPRGVYRVSGANTFQARITAAGKEHYLGCFKTVELAKAAHLDAKRIFHDWIEP